MSSLWRWLRKSLQRFQKKKSQTLQPTLPFMVRYDRVFESLTVADLQLEDDFTLNEEDLSSGLFDPGQRNRHFLNLYSEHGAELAFERYGFFQLLRDKGMKPFITIDMSDRDEHWARVYDGIESPEHLLIELAVGFKEMTLPNQAQCRLLFINWLMMQNPNKTFSPGTEPLPDQKHPGLGLFIHFGYLLVLIGKRLACDGLLNHPSYFHNGVLYGKFFHFADPEMEGRFLALQRDLEDLSLVASTRAVGDGRVVDANNGVFRWKPLPQIMPISKRARAWFESEEYRIAVEAARDQSRFRVI